MSRHRDEPVYDVVTPTQGERRRAEQRFRERRYKKMMALCLTLMVLGFLIPAPVAVRGVFFVTAAIIPPLAAVLANGISKR